MQNTTKKASLDTCFVKLFYSMFNVFNNCDIFILVIFMKNYIKRILKGIAVILIFYFSTLFQYIPIILFKMDINKMKGNYSLAVLLSVFSALCVSILIIIIYRKELVNEFKKFKNNFSSCIDTGVACWILGLIIMVVSNVVISYFFKAGGAKNEEAVQTLISAAPIYMALDVCLLAPFNEEMVFRKALRDITFNKYLFIFLSFLIFGGAHVIGSATSIVDYLYIIPYGVLGGMFAYAYTKTDTIFTTITFHMIHNTALFLISILL